MTRLSSTLLILLAIVASSCSKDNTNPVTPPAAAAASDYWMPSGSGTRIVLQGDVITSRDGVVLDSSRQTTTMTMIGTKKTTLDGKSASAFQTISVSTGGKPDTTESYAVLSATAITMYDSSLAAFTASTILLFPLSVGNTWLYQPSDTVHYSLASISETVVTPGGTFSNCLRLRHLAVDPATGATTDENFYMARGVGLVRLSMHGSYTLLGSTVTYNMDMKLLSKNF